jgi:osmotically inducible protein OsmC
MVMPIRNSKALWTGKLKQGKGKIQLGSGAYEDVYSFASRFEQGAGTNPEELIAAAHAGCFSMALTNELEQAKYEPEKIDTECAISLERADVGFKIAKIELRTKAKVPGMSKQTFLNHAENAKTNCPLSQALRSVEINLRAELET